MVSKSKKFRDFSVLLSATTLQACLIWQALRNIPMPYMCYSLANDNTMNTPEYFMSPSTAWHNWVSTTAAHVDSHFICASAGRFVNSPKYYVEKKHPGFTAAYKTLVALGCDQYFVTSVLKFCIIHADSQLDDFLIASKVLKVIPTALSMGLTGDEFVASLSIGAIESTNISLPNDMTFLKT